jgi:hypothetical protein
MVPTSSIASASVRPPPIGRECATELEPFAIEQPEVGGPAVGDVDQPARLQHVDDTHVRSGAALVRTLHGADEHILEHGHADERARNLMRASNTEPAAPIRAHAGDVIPLVANAARCGTD